jgi:hypothetical protein
MYGLNYTGAAQLYQSWEGHKDNDKYFKSSGFARELEKAQSAAPNAASNELNYNKLTESFKTTMSQFGTQYFDIKLGDLPAAIATALKNAGFGEKGENTAVPELKLETKPVAQAKSDEKSAQKAYQEALKSRNPDEVERAARNLEIAQINSLNADYGAMEPQFIERQRIRAGYATNKFFSAGSIFSFRKTDEEKADAAAQNKFSSIFDAALGSGDEQKIKAAASAFDILDNIPQDVRKEWDKDNTLNRLADTKGIEELLRRLIEIAENDKRIELNVQ